MKGREEKRSEVKRRRHTKRRGERRREESNEEKRRDHTKRREEK